MDPKHQKNNKNNNVGDKMAANFADDIFRYTSVDERFYDSITISLKFDPSGLIDNNTALVKMMAWRRIGDKSLSEPMLTQFSDAYMRHYHKYDKVE